MATQKNVLFVICQAGSAAYCMPLWEEWLLSPPDFGWYIIADNQALKMMHDKNLPIIRDYKLDSLMHIDVVITSATNNKLEVDFAYFADKASATHLQFLDAPYNISARIKNSNPAETYPDYIFVVNENNRQEIIAHGILPKVVFTIGHPIWEKTANLEFLPRDKNVFVFASQPISSISELAELGYNEHIVWNLACALKREHPDIISELIYCPHPSQTHVPDHFDIGTRLIRPDENPILIAGSMIGMFSALMVDAFLSGQNVVSCQPNLKQDDRCILSQSGLIAISKSGNPENLMHAIKRSADKDNAEFKKLLQGSLARFNSTIRNIASS